METSVKRPRWIRSVDMTDLLVYGYIRRLDQLLGGERTVPFSLYEMCRAFYLSKLPMIVWSRFDFEDGHAKIFGGLDVENLSAFSLSCDGDDAAENDFEFVPWCHIPSVAVSGSTFDGMLATKYPSNAFSGPPYSDSPTKCALGLLLYDASAARLGGTVNVKNTLTHPLDMWQMSQFIWCAQRNSAIYEFNAELYTCALNVGGFDVKKLKQNKKMLVKSLPSLEFKTCCGFQVRCIAE